MRYSSEERSNAIGFATATYPSRGFLWYSKKKGFAFVELMVVISIIAFLIAMLLPALNRARQQSASLQCVSNLRQIAKMFQVYEEDYQGSLIPSQMPGAVSSVSNWALESQFSLRRKTDVTYQLAADIDPVFFCPASINYDANGKKLYSYAVGTALCGDLAQYPPQIPLKLAQVHNASQSILVFEEIAPGNWPVEGYPDGSGNMGSINLHPNSTQNFLMCDGHVETLSDPGLSLSYNARVIIQRSNISHDVYTTTTKTMWFRQSDRYAANVNP